MSEASTGTSGIVSTLSYVYRSDVDTFSPWGNEATGGYTLQDLETTNQTTIAESTRTTAEAASGITGIHDVYDTDTATPSSSLAYVRNGNMISGDYSLTQTATAGLGDVNAATDDQSASGGPTSEQDDVTDNAAGATTQSSSLSRTGNTITGSYTLAQTDSSASSQTDTASENAFDTPGDGEHDVSASVLRTTNTGGSSDTINRMGNAKTGAFSLTDAATDSSTVKSTDTATNTDDLADGGVESTLDVLQSSAYQTVGTSLVQVGNSVSGGYSATGTNSDSSNSTDSDSDTVTDAEASGETDRDVSTQGASDYLTSLCSLSGLGNFVTASYSEHDVGSETTGDSASTIVAGGSPTSYTRTVMSTDSSTAANGWNDSTGSSSQLSPSPCGPVGRTEAEKAA